MMSVYYHIFVYGFMFCAFIDLYTYFLAWSLVRELAWSGEPWPTDWVCQLCVAMARLAAVGLGRLAGLAAEILKKNMKMCQ